MPRRPQNGTLGIAIPHTSVSWTKGFCSGRIGVATKKGSKQQCPTSPKVGRLATRGRQPSSKLRSWYWLGNSFPPFSTIFFLSKSKTRLENQIRYIVWVQLFNAPWVQRFPNKLNFCIIPNSNTQGTNIHQYVFMLCNIFKSRVL